MMLPADVQPHSQVWFKSFNGIKSGLLLRRWELKTLVEVDGNPELVLSDGCFTSEADCLMVEASRLSADAAKQLALSAEYLTRVNNLRTSPDVA